MLSPGSSRSCLQSWGKYPGPLGGRPSGYDAGHSK